MEVDSTKTPSDVTLLGRTSSEIFVVLFVVVHSFLFVLHFVVDLHFCYCSSFIAFQRHPSPFRELSPGFYTHFILSAQPITEWFATFSFFPRSSFTVLQRLPTGVFYLILHHQHFTCVYQGFPGSRLFFLEVSRLHADPQNTRPAHLFVWFTAIHRLHIQKNSFLNSTKYYHELLVVKV